MQSSRNLDLHDLEVFDLLMRERSVSRAAERLGVSQSWTSEILARLRDRFSDPLLVRTREGMAPTARAEQLLPQVRQAMDQLRALLDQSPVFDQLIVKERFQITTSDYTQLLLMPALMRQLTVEAPGCTVDVLPINILRIEQALDAGDIQLAIAYYPEPPTGLRCSPLFTDRHVYIARQQHPSVSQSLTAEQFASLDHVSVAPSGLSYFSSVVDSALETLGLRRKVTVSSPHFLLAAHLVSQSDLVLSLPSQAARALAMFFPLQILEIPMQTRAIDVAMYWHERCHHDTAQQWFRERVKDSIVQGALASLSYGAAA